MFDSGISAAMLVEELKSEADIAVPIPDKKYLEWLSALEQLLYSEFIQEQRREYVEVMETVSGSMVTDPPEIKKWEKHFCYLSDIKPGSMEAPVRFEDIYTIFTEDGLQLIQSTITSGVVFNNTWFKRDDDRIGFHLADYSARMEVVYFVRPRLKATEAECLMDDPVWLPYEFLDLVRAKLRGEAYKLVNEDSLAAKWINDYNVLLETFKAWVSGKQPKFGM